jgi:transporter family protein
MTAKWLVPTLVYVVVLGALGVTTKIALRTVSWQDLLLWTTAGYVLVAAFLLISGQTGFHWEAGSWWVVLSAALTISALITLYLALGAGEASKVIPVSAAYPAVTVLLSAATLSEHVSLARLGGLALVVGGVVVLTAAD